MCHVTGMRATHYCLSREWRQQEHMRLPLASKIDLSAPRQCVRRVREKEAGFGGEDRERSGGGVECAGGHQLLRYAGRGRYGVGGVVGARARSERTSSPPTSR